MSEQLNSDNSSVSVVSWMFIAIQAVILLLIIFLNIGNAKISGFEIFASTFLKVLGAVGLFISAFNLGKSLTALPDPKKKAVLQTDGLYKYVRHPMYTSVILLCFGIAGASGSIIKTVLCILLTILFVLKARFEEGLLSRKYKNYKQYANSTPMFLPIKFDIKK